MRSRDDIESYLARAEVPYEEVGADGMWLVRDSSLGENIAIQTADSLLLFRVKVLELDEVNDKEALYEELLENVTSQMINKIVSKFAMHLKSENTQANQSIKVMKDVFNLETTEN